ncbi:unnamed protein product [Adineta ricciae]|uniref:Uncharacterized protein n=1 Tax=Adineta ricciae TaxID=249248 RepID=A0A813WRT7_ADIRI|nr:unnamed protein product [Adineta ricciae]
MGSNKSKQPKYVKPYVRPKPVEKRPVVPPEPEPVPEPPKKITKRIPKVFPRYIPRRDRLHSPQTKRPIELSWLQKNGENDNYSRINYHYHGLHQYHYHGHHHHHHHQSLHDNEHDTRIPLAIKRWPVNNDLFGRSRFRIRPEMRTKSFIDEYVYQKKGPS